MANSSEFPGRGGRNRRGGLRRVLPWLALLLLAIPGPLCASARGGPLSNDPEVRKYGDYLARIRLATYGMIHARSGEDTAGRVREESLRDMAIRIFYSRKGVREGYRVEEREFREYREARERAFVNAEVLGKILEEQGVPVPEYDRMLEFEILSSRYTKEKILPSVTVSDEEVRDYYDRNRGAFRVKGKIKVDILALSRTGPFGKDDESRALALALDTSDAQGGLAAGADGRWKREFGEPYVVRVTRDVLLNDNSGAPYDRYYRDMRFFNGKVATLWRDSGLSVVFVREKVDDRFKPFPEVEARIRAQLREARFSQEILKRYLEAGGEI